MSVTDGGSTQSGYASGMTFHAGDVAAALRERLPRLPKKKLHKLLYYCQGHHLATMDVPLFTESLSAWDMGPVVGPLWKAEDELGPAAPSAELDEAALNTVGYVVSRYGRLSGRDLELLTHAEEPWSRANATRRPKGSVRIETAWLTDYFGSEADDDDDELPLDSDVVSRWLSGAPARLRDELHQDSYEALRGRRHVDAS